MPLRHVLSATSIVLRVNPDGTFVPFQQMPTLFFERALRNALSESERDRFFDACKHAAAHVERTLFRPDPAGDDAVLVAPVLDDATDEVHYLLCWVRTGRSMDQGRPAEWTGLSLNQVVTRFRMRTTGEQSVVEASPWWANNAELHELWPHHAHIAAMGLGHAVMELLIIDAAEAAADTVGGPAVRIVVPSAELLSGLVPVFHGAVRATGLNPERIIVAIDVELAADPDLLPIIVHLRTMGLKIDVVGLDALTATLHAVSDSSSYTHPVKVDQANFGPWVSAFTEAATPVA